MRVPYSITLNKYLPLIGKEKGGTAHFLHLFFQMTIALMLFSNIFYLKLNIIRIFHYLNHKQKCSHND